MGPHARTDRTRDARDAEPWLPAPEDGQPREGQRLTPGAPHHGGWHPPRDALPPHPQRATPARKDARCGAGAETPRPHRPHPGHAEPWLPAPEDGRPGAAAPTTPSQVGGNQDRTAPPQARQTEHGTGAGHAEGHGPHGTALPAPSAGTTRDARATPPSGGGSGHRESASAHTRKEHAGTTGRATEPSARNAQTAWNGVPASEGKGHPDRDGPPHAARNTRGGKGETGETQHQVPARTPPEPAASAAHTQTGHCTRQGSSGAQRHAPTPRLGSLRASPRGSHWRQASSTGPAVPAPRATTH